jgi:hypothetical protein
MMARTFPAGHAGGEFRIRGPSVEVGPNIRHFAKSACLFGLLQPLAFAQPNPGAATVLVDEFDPCGNKGSFNLLKRRRVAGVSTDFNVIDCIPMKARCLGQVPNSPV